MGFELVDSHTTYKLNDFPEHCFFEPENLDKAVPLHLALVEIPRKPDDRYTWAGAVTDSTAGIRLNATNRKISCDSFAVIH